MVHNFGEQPVTHGIGFKVNCASLPHVQSPYLPIKKMVQGTKYTLHKCFQGTFNKNIFGFDTQPPFFKEGVVTLILQKKTSLHDWEEGS